MRLLTGLTVLMLSATLALPALADQSGGTMDSGSVGMGTGASRLDRSAAPDFRLGAGTSGMYKGTSGSDMPHWTGDTSRTSVTGTNTATRSGSGTNNHS